MFIVYFTYSEIWKNGIDAVQRIRDIEYDTYLVEIEVFHSIFRAREVYFDLVKEATKEIPFLFPSFASALDEDTWRACMKILNDEGLIAIWS